MHREAKKLQASPILITHTDFDGVTCAILFKAVWPEGTVYYEDYKTVDERITFVLESASLDTSVYITDISPSGSDATEIAAVIQKRVQDHGYTMLFDHHETAKWLNLYGWAHVNSNWCGARLFHKFLTTEKGRNLSQYDDLAYLADTYDRWQTDSPSFEHASGFSRLLYILGRERFVKRFLASPEMLRTNAEALLLELDDERQVRYINKVMDNVQTMKNTDGSKYSLCFAEEYTSQIGHAELGRSGFVDYVAIVNLKAGIVSLRSREGGYDVSALAKEYGGGGHQAAAGFQLDMHHTMAIDGQIFPKHTQFFCGVCKLEPGDSADYEEKRASL